MTQSGDAKICNKPWAEWFGANYSGMDRGSTISKWPADAQLVRWAEALLNFTASE